MSGKAGADADSEFACSISSSASSYLSSFLTPERWLAHNSHTNTYRQIDLSTPKMVMVMVKI